IIHSWRGRLPFYFRHFCVCVLKRSFALSPNLDCSGVITAYCSFNLLGSSDPHTSASQVARTTDVCHRTWLIFVFFVEMGSNCIAQAGLELLGSSSWLTSVSQSVGITAVSHHTQPPSTIL
uniref:Uncharacterized protein n=1 Tax=Theropithecus gelada TaxID=9565 RepID=A0A8D2G157_THEGE